MQLCRLQVVVVDDIATNCKLLKHMVAGVKLKGGGKPIVQTFTSGFDAVENCASGQVDIVFMDLHMPECDGLETAKLIRHQELELGLPRTHICCISASSSKEDRKAVRESGMDFYLPKPFGKLEVAAFLNTIPRQHARSKKGRRQGKKG